MVRLLLRFISWLLSLSAGLLIALAIVVGGAIVTIRYVVAQIVTDPPRPTFANENTAPLTLTRPSTPQATPIPRAPEPETPPTPTPTPSGAYRARVTLSGGLTLRSQPRRDSDRIGGVQQGDEVIVLGQSADGRWQRVRVGDNGPEAWIIADNTAPIEPPP
ncbi:MAG: SH3 domain-containing protein [Cyanobacteria bacterium]|nr:SH3 domain-containing protein [Cyanobacteriota bacterium]